MKPLKSTCGLVWERERSWLTNRTEAHARAGVLQFIVRPRDTKRYGRSCRFALIIFRPDMENAHWRRLLFPTAQQAANAACRIVTRAPARAQERIVRPGRKQQTLFGARR